MLAASDHAGGGSCCKKPASLDDHALLGWPAGKVGPLPPYQGKGGPAASCRRWRGGATGGRAARVEPPVCPAPAHDRERRTIERQKGTETAYRSDMLARGAERDRVGILRRARCARLAPVARHQRACTPESLGRYTELSSQVSLRLRCGRLNLLRPAH